MSKGISKIVTSALYLGISITAISVVLTIGLPALENMRDASSVEGAQSFMHTLDSNIQEVVAEGEGSTRIIDLDFERGEIYFDENLEMPVYEIETDADVISPQASQRIGNVILSSNANVNVFEDNVTIGGEEVDCFRMENERVSACIKKAGEDGVPEEMDTSELLVEYKRLEDDEHFNGELEVLINDDQSSAEGSIYTEAEDTGQFIGTGRVRATIQDINYEHEILFSLPSGADFLHIDVNS